MNFGLVHIGYNYFGIGTKTTAAEVKEVIRFLGHHINAFNKLIMVLNCRLSWP